jgi:hypothetical protein
MRSLAAVGSWWHSVIPSSAARSLTECDSRPVTMAQVIPASCSSRIPSPSWISKRFSSTRSPASVAPR